MKKQIIRLTENDLHKIIKESVKRIMKECDCGNTMGGATNANISAASSYEMPVSAMQRKSIYSPCLDHNDMCTQHTDDAKEKNNVNKKK